MPPSANPPAGVPAKTPVKKGSLAGMPKWAWIGAAGIGLIIGYMIVKKSGGSPTPPAAAGSDSGSSANPLGVPNSDTGGGVVAAPPPDMSGLMNQLQAMGLSSGTSTGTTAPSGDTSIAPATDATNSFVSSPAAPMQDVAQHVQQGYAVAPPPGSNIHVPGAQM
jgi:hypothetical protein